MKPVLRLFRELRRRRVFRVVVAYVIAGWVAIQVAVAVEPALGLPGWTDKLVIVLVAVGFPIAVVLSWALEVSPEGVRVERSMEEAGDEREVVSNPPDPITDRPGSKPTATDGVEGSDLDALPEPGQDVEQYRIVEQLADGDGGTVFKARHLRLQRTVTLKLLPRRFSVDSAARHRLTEAARAAAALDHPNICTVHEIGETSSGRLFLATACYEGETLERVLSRGSLPIPRALEIASQIARGLEHAHARDVLHHHLRPANVMVTAEGPIKLLEFGLVEGRGEARPLGPESAPDARAYMSPEQTRAEAVDARTDIWSLGVVLYEMVAGQRPFRGGDDRALLAAIRSDDPPPIRDVRPEAPPDLEAVVERALARDPGDRYPSASALLVDLEAVDLEATSAAGADRALHPEGERRLTCVMVVRLAEYAELVERLLPDRLEEVSERIRTWTHEVVEAHGGVVNEVGEEHLVSLFGVPVTHEDDPIRGARAARELLDRVDAGGAGWERRSDRPEIRVGLAAGRVVVRPGSSSNAPPYRISGEAYALARRLSSLAKRNEVLVSGDSVRLLRGHFETQAKSPVPGPEDEPPLRPHRLRRELDRRTELEAAELEGLTEYVGRKREMDTLASAHRSAAEGSGRLVVVEGEAGVGKSRLLHELRRRLAEKDLRVLHGRCRSEGGAAPYGPFIQALWDLLELDPDDGVASRKDSADLVARRIRAISPDLADRTPFYLHLLSIEDPSRPLPGHLEREHLRVALHESLVAAFTVAAREGLTVLLLEDWHWTDEASHEVLEGLGEMVAAHPLLIVVTLRPRSDLVWKGTVPDETIQLAPLSPEASGGVIRDVLGAASLPGPLRDLLHERTEGNPFFLEEVCRTLIEEDTVRVDEQGRAELAGPRDRLVLPETVQGVIRTRLDRLDAAARRILLTASVLGREFDRSLLEEVWQEQTDGETAGEERALDKGLDTLRDYGLIQRVRVVPEPTYRFNHALTQEVAYDTLLLHRRRELHARAGRAVEHRLDRQEVEQPDLLAHHFSQAEDWERAVRYGMAAAERATELSQFSEALRSIERTKEWANRLSDPTERHEARIEVLLSEERLCEVLGLRERQQELIDELVSILERGESEARLAEVYLRQGDLYTLLRRFEEAETALRRSLAIAREREDRVAERNVLRSIGLMRWHQDRNEEALEAMEETLAIDREREDREAIAGDLANIGSTLISKGAYEEALAVLRDALRLAEEIGNPVKQVFILDHLGSLRRQQGETEEAIRFLKEAIELGDVHRLPIQQSFHLTKLARIELEQGRLEEAIDHYVEAVELNRRAGAAEALAQSLRMLGDTLLSHDRHEEALPRLREAAALFGPLGLGDDRAHMLEHLALANEQAGNAEEAVQTWARLRELQRERDDPEGELEATEGMARGLRDDDPARALELYDEALEAARRLELPGKEGELLNAAGIVEWERGEYRSALERYEAALELYRELGDEEKEGFILNSIGVTLSDLGCADEARRRLEAALEMHRRRGTLLLEGYALAALAELDLEAGELADARERFEASLRIRRELGDRRGEGWMLLGLARAAEDGERAAEVSRRAEEIGRELPDPELVEETRSLRS